jgi:transcriptional regulator with XRE-family HTH domain
MATKTPINPLAAKIGERMRAFRRARGMKQDTLAAEVGYSSRAAIAQFENGFALPSLEKAIDIARALSIHPGELFKEGALQAEKSDLGMTYRAAMQASPACRAQLVIVLRAMADDLEQTLARDMVEMQSLQWPNETAADKDGSHFLPEAELEGVLCVLAS